MSGFSSPVDNALYCVRCLGFRKQTTIASGPFDSATTTTTTHVMIWTRYNIPLSNLSAVSLALYPQQYLSAEYVLDKYKVPTYHVILRTRFISPSALPVFNIRLCSLSFAQAACPIHVEQINKISIIKLEHSIALVHYIYTHEVSLTLGSILVVVVVRLTEEDLRQPKIASVSWEPAVLLMMQTQTERELDDVDVGIIAFCKTASRLGMHCGYLGRS
ncbi:hypothetical protein ARMSODRAFT_1025902 [Armillaria solidipes]|uniref:Uncharacterized protein n=1 Tax=Armillaria solidipes TaxID=1076256 RepID=A0A2H3AQW1_9AGAR|nr:hypothetical protein ARMSODRAFT_1025902 [Armillaria solidipes]